MILKMNTLIALFTAFCLYLSPTYGKSPFRTYQSQNLSALLSSPAAHRNTSRLQDGQSSSRCGPDWTSYQPEDGKDGPEKCFKVFADATLMTFPVARRFCAQQRPGGQLLTITSYSEQSFINDLLFEQPKAKPVEDNVWLGAAYFDDEGEFKWTPRSGQPPVPLGVFNHWSLASSPKSLLGSCIRLTGSPADSERDGGRGKWVAESCHNKNLVVCEVVLGDQQDNEDCDRRLSDQLEFLKEKVSMLEVRVEEIESSLKAPTTQPPTTPEPEPEPTSPETPLPQIIASGELPLGFVYFQLPREKSPREMFPSQQWTDISTSYPGLFFRVDGSGAAPFGEVQEESAPQIDSVVYQDCIEGQSNHPKSCDPAQLGLSLNFTQAIKSGEPWTRQITTANFYNSHAPNAESWTGSLKFHSTNGPIRPRNMAVKLWLRTA